MWLQLFFGWLLGFSYVAAYVVCGFQGVANVLRVVARVLLWLLICYGWFPRCCYAVANVV